MTLPGVHPREIPLRFRWRDRSTNRPSGSQSLQRGEPQRPSGISCGDATRSPSGRALPLTLVASVGKPSKERWSHQIPLSGNPHQVLAPQRAAHR